MSRSCYTDDYGDEFPGQLELFRANVERSIRGKNGQARLTELRDALLAMPVKALHADLWRRGGSVCALGAWASDRPVQVSNAADDYDIAAALVPLGWPRLVVLEVVYLNDADEWEYVMPEGPPRFSTSDGRLFGFPDRVRVPITPERRYQRVLAWVQDSLSGKPHVE